MNYKKYFAPKIADRLNLPLVFYGENEAEYGNPIDENITSKRNIEYFVHNFKDDKELLGHLLLISSKVAKSEGLNSWRTIINTGAEAGQTVFHLHIHVIGGRKLSWPPG